MRALVETDEGPAIARALIRDVELVVAGRALRVEEAEAYYFGPGLRDPFAHRHPAQARAGRWYFHRAGRSYRGGSFKGLDLTFGPPGAFGGVLIRTLSDDAGWTCGPSLCVDRLLALAGRGSIAELDEGRDALDPSAILSLRAAPREVALLRTARVGLTLKRCVAGDERPRHPSPARSLPERSAAHRQRARPRRDRAPRARPIAGRDPRRHGQRRGRALPSSATRRAGGARASSASSGPRSAPGTTPSSTARGGSASAETSRARRAIRKIVR